MIEHIAIEKSSDETIISNDTSLIPVQKNLSRQNRECAHGEDSNGESTKKSEEHPQTSDHTSHFSQG